MKRKRKQKRKRKMGRRKKMKKKGKVGSKPTQNPYTNFPPTPCKLLSSALDYKVFKAGLEAAIKQFA